ncbi:MAG TPA: glutathione S-transferase [Hyphomicrobiaceae bacterium]|nr:glutathione S-transferase [Hyphomicrobiaceae bacterium]
MKLFWSSRSPFVRKVMVVAHELALVDRIATERVIVSATKPNVEVMKYNPLAKLPTLILDDGRAVYDSRVICEYLDGLAGGTLHPRDPARRLDAIRLNALGDGMMDVLLLWVLERVKPAEQQQQALVEGCRLKLSAVLATLEADAARIEAMPIDIGHLAIGTALGYLDFRFPAEAGWRASHPKLAAWHAKIAARPSFMATMHADVY